MKKIKLMGYYPTVSILLAVIIFILGWIYRLTFQTFFNIIFNSFWSVKIFCVKIAEVLHLRFTKQRFNVNDLKGISFDQLEEYYELFKYSYDGFVKTPKDKTKIKWYHKFPTWTALPFITHYRGIIGNCQDAHVWGRYIVKQWAKLHNEKVSTKTGIYLPFTWNLAKMFNNVHYYTLIKYTENVTFSSGKVVKKEEFDYIQYRMKEKDIKYWIKLV